jgi:hypothetical protein
MHVDRYRGDTRIGDKHRAPQDLEALQRKILTKLNLKPGDMAVIEGVGPFKVRSVVNRPGAPPVVTDDRNGKPVNILKLSRLEPVGT